MRQREAGAHDIGGGLGDGRGARRHHDFGHLRLRRERRDGERDRREAEARDEGDLVVDDEFLRNALGHIGRAGVVLDDQLDLLAGDLSPFCCM